MHDIRIITQGTDFTLRVRAKRLGYNSFVKVAFSEIANIQVNLVSLPSQKTPLSYSYDEYGRLIIPVDGQSLDCNTYALEITGFYNNGNWRQMLAPVVQIVHSSELDNYPAVQTDEVTIDLDVTLGETYVSSRSFAKTIGEMENTLTQKDEVLEETKGRVADLESAVADLPSFIPTKTSQLTNDSSFQTEQQVSTTVQEAIAASRINDAEANLIENGGEPDLIAGISGQKIILVGKNLKGGKGDKGNGITGIEVDEQEGDEAENTVTFKTNENPEGVSVIVRNGSRGNGIESISETPSDEDGGTNVVTIHHTDPNVPDVELQIKNGRRGRPGEDRQPINDTDLIIAHGIGNSVSKVMDQNSVTEEFKNTIKRSVNGVAVSYPANNAATPLVKINASTGNIESASTTNDRVYFNAVKFAKGDVIQITGSGSTARSLIFGFTTTDPASLQTLVGLQLTDVVATAVTTSFNLELICPYDNAYLLYYRYSSYTVNFTRYSLSAVKNLPSTISANKTDIETKLATEVREMVTKSTVESTFSYSDSQSGAYIDSSGEITTYQYKTRKVYYSSKVFKKGDIIHLTTSGSNAMVVVVGFSTTNPVTRMTEQQTLVGMMLTNVSSFASTAAHDRWIVVPFDNAYMLYYSESSTLTFTWTVNSLSSIKSIPATIANDEFDEKWSRAVKTESGYDKLNKGKSIASDGTAKSESAYAIRSFYVDGEFDSITVRTSTASGRVVAFYSDHEFSSDSLISMVTGVYTLSTFTRTIPSGCKMISVVYYADNGVPTNDLKVILGKSGSYFGAYDRKFESLNDFNIKVTRMEWAPTGANSVSIVKKFYTVPGHRYRIRRSVYSWSVENIADSTEIIGLYSVSGSTETQIYRRTKSQMVSAMMPNPYDFTADAVDYYKLYFKADTGTVVRFDIQDITEIVPLIGVGTSDVVQMCGGLEAMQLRMANIAMAGGLRLLYFSDVHTGTGALAQMQNFKNLAGNIHDVLSGGDNVNDQPTDDYAFANYKSMLTVVGNHDVYSGPTKLPTKDVFDIYFGEHTTHWSGVTFPENYDTLGLCYWYKDYTTPKVRLIGLDCINWSTEQKTWLASVLADAITNSLHVVICMHYKPYNFVGERTCTFNSLVEMSAQYASEEINTTVLAAISNGLKFVCYLFGHEHKPYFGHVSDHNDLWAFAADKPSPPIGNNNSDRRNVGGGSLYKSHYSFYIINVDTVRGVIAISTVGNNRDMYERPMNNLVFDYINHQIMSNT